jgi:hypothetical protein
MLFMVIEHFRNQDAKAVYRRFRERGRQAPEGLDFVASWVSADLGRCFQVMECEDVTLLQRWASAWSDLVEMEIVPVAPGKDVAQALGPETEADDGQSKARLSVNVLVSSRPARLSLAQPLELQGEAEPGEQRGEKQEQAEQAFEGGAGAVDQRHMPEEHHRGKSAGKDEAEPSREQEEVAEQLACDDEGNVQALEPPPVAGLENRDAKAGDELVLPCQVLCFSESVDDAPEDRQELPDQDRHAGRLYRQHGEIEQAAGA